MESEPDDINDYLDELVDEIDAANARRIPYDVPPQWDSTYYLRRGFLIRRSTSSSAIAKHCRGAMSPTRECPTCRVPLRLLLDIDCADTRFKSEKAPVFGDLARLPLYYCFHCAGRTTYRVTNSRVAFLRDDCTKDDDSPFAEPSVHPVERASVKLQRIPSDVEDLLVIAQEYSTNWLSKRQMRQIKSALGNHAVGLSRSQFGGLPYLMQGHRNYSCKNPKCKTHQMVDFWTARRPRFKMKELATCLHDLHGYDSARYTAIVFHICWYCHTVTSEYECT